MARITIGNNVTRGFVNLVADRRIIVGTGSYTNGAGEKVFKESVTVFFDANFDGEIPAKGKYVEISGDLTVQPRKDNADQLNATYNVRFKNQVVEKEAPQKAAAPAGAGADADI
ncbi:hypothetical protein WJ96_04900 [Burkholderia ubonensis]|uniref:Single-stranded DNA-binding protein n=1 Tax=Burkholderia ubonensis TaxID=101571 RepID=A0AAW3MTJ5_9BURK|nr:hypothetical protein [Burkholderia ubonensis]KVP75106.1 hypothetical protein WJ93_06735 [Burkholderia ubonensis]KVP97912.1 hypothetical protein WJ96_04900 [Burkholderia ubonensis]KVZ92609.1 hypothetical protein WL25_16555 [Burkholderia ubonensis]